jgi:hypothetical protein
MDANQNASPSLRPDGPVSTPSDKQIVPSVANSGNGSEDGTVETTVPCKSPLCSSLLSVVDVSFTAKKRPISTTAITSQAKSRHTMSDTPHDVDLMDADGHIHAKGIVFMTCDGS